VVRIEPKIANLNWLLLDSWFTRGLHAAVETPLLLYLFVTSSYTRRGLWESSQTLAPEIDRVVAIIMHKVSLVGYMLPCRVKTACTLREESTK